MSPLVRAGDRDREAALAGLLVKNDSDALSQHCPAVVEHLSRNPAGGWCALNNSPVYRFLERTGVVILQEQQNGPRPSLLLAKKL